MKTITRFLYPAFVKAKGNKGSEEGWDVTMMDNQKIPRNCNPLAITLNMGEVDTFG